MGRFIDMSRFKIWSNTAEFMSLEHIQPQPMAELHQYWEDRVKEGQPPTQKDLSIRDMPDCLDNIALLDIGITDKERPRLQAKYLIIGEALKKLLGSDPTGLPIEDVYADNIAEEIYGAIKKCAKQRQALYFRREFQILNKSFGYNRLMLPLRLNGERVARVLICIYPLDKNLVSAEQWQNEVTKMKEMEARERRYESAWAESLGYTVVTKDDDVLDLTDEDL